MKGTIIFEAPGDGNLKVTTRLEHISMRDKAKLVAGMFRALELDITNPVEVGLICFTAAEAEKKASITRIEAAVGLRGDEET